MRRDPVRLRSGQQLLFYFVFALLLLTGLVWAAIDYNFWATGEATDAPKAYLMKVHGAAAMVALLLIGSLLPGHVRLGWLLRRNRANGIIILVVVAVLIVSGYLLYYAGGESLRAWTSRIHLIVGAGFPLCLIVHIWRGRRSRRSAVSARPEALAVPAKDLAGPGLIP